jgi:uncharacterized repeat protein (TIGR01451 family)
MTFRTLARVGAAGLLAAGALAATATPALAAGDADLAVSAKGVTVSVGALVKLGSLTVANRSDVDAKGVTVAIDVSSLDMSRAVVVPPTNATCRIEGDGTLFVCPIGDIAARSTYKEDLPVAVTGEETGAAGVVKLSVQHEGTDPDKANNAVEVPVAVGGNGVDLRVRAFDVPTDEGGTVGTVAPGETAFLTFQVSNQGTQTSKGLKLTIKLPRHTTFVGEYEGCTMGARRSAVDCYFPKLLVLPLLDPAAQVLEGGFEVAVSSKATGGVTLTDGAVTVAATGAVSKGDVPDEAAIMRQSAASLPSYLEFAAAPKDVDATDNTDSFVVYVADAGGEGGGDGGLPVTGPAALAIGAGGVAVLVAGLVLFLVTRRRRVVLVTPGDEK